MTDLEKKIDDHTYTSSEIREMYENRHNNFGFQQWGEDGKITENTYFVRYDRLAKIFQEAMKEFPNSEEYPDIDKFVLKQLGLTI